MHTIKHQDLVVKSSSGPFNLKSSNGITVTHTPTKITVTCDYEQSQSKNHLQALKELQRQVNEHYDGVALDKWTEVSISIESKLYKMRYAHTGDEVTHIEILDNAFHVDKRKKPEWVCVGELFNLFVEMCTDHLANLKEDV